MSNALSQMVERQVGAALELKGELSTMSTLALNIEPETQREKTLVEIIEKLASVSNQLVDNQVYMSCALSAFVQIHEGLSDNLTGDMLRNTLYVAAQERGERLINKGEVSNE